MDDTDNYMDDGMLPPVQMGDNGLVGKGDSNQQHPPPVEAIEHSTPPEVLLKHSNDLEHDQEIPIDPQFPIQQNGHAHTDEHLHQELSDSEVDKNYVYPESNSKFGDDEDVNGHDLNKEQIPESDLIPNYPLSDDDTGNYPHTQLEYQPNPDLIQIDNIPPHNLSDETAPVPQQSPYANNKDSELMYNYPSELDETPPEVPEVDDQELFPILIPAPDYPQEIETGPEEDYTQSEEDDYPVVQNTNLPPNFDDYPTPPPPESPAVIETQHDTFIVPGQPLEEDDLSEDEGEFIVEPFPQHDIPENNIVTDEEEGRFGNNPPIPPAIYNTEGPGETTPEPPEIYEPTSSPVPVAMDTPAVIEVTNEPVHVPSVECQPDALSEEEVSEETRISPEPEVPSPSHDGQKYVEVHDPPAQVPMETDTHEEHHNPENIHHHYEYENQDNQHVDNIGQTNSNNEPEVNNSGVNESDNNDTIHDTDEHGSSGTVLIVQNDQRNSQGHDKVDVVESHEVIEIEESTEHKKCK